MTFGDIVSGLKIPSFRSKLSVDNIAWILNCVPLKEEERQALHNEIRSLDHKINIIVDGDFTFLG